MENINNIINNYSGNDDDDGSNEGGSNPLQVHIPYPLAYHTIAKSKSFKSNDSLIGHHDINFSPTNF